MRSPIQLFAIIAMALATATVAAQVYKWVDKDGKTQYTDTPPPPNAIKGEAKKLNTGANAAPVAPPAPNAKATAEKAKATDKRAEEEKSAKKAEDDKKTTQVNAEQCSAAKRAIASLESGRPMATTSETGERAILSDEERAKDLTRARAVAAESCKN